jgi:DNA-directed RNA polymerase specialized sigma24 family protein
MMTTSGSEPKAPPSPVRVPEARLPAGAEAAFRDALVASLDGLPLCDRNLLRFHYFHGLGADQLAGMFSSQPTAVLRQLGRIRERMLRDVRRGLAARLSLDRPELDRLLELARDRFDLAITRVLRA